ncbi:hypothetical protein BDY19DRAFT_909572 [Irpex rosettiformis]|uniref:Uncharacterized protein n=1 Tax=Irpex rosettiformis TaxID=378272 RepID=A0ACB8TS17_9APHY|nr:hypothetical protein BDY19DRAFT_909572 [Irpex rosettiformis]
MSSVAAWGSVPPVQQGDLFGGAAGFWLARAERRLAAAPSFVPTPRHPLLRLPFALDLLASSFSSPPISSPRRHRPLRRRPPRRPGSIARNGAISYRQPGSGLSSRKFMTQIQGEMATQLPQSLPSFAQTFGGPSLNRLPDVNNALPPIQHRPPPMDRSRSAHTSPQPSSMGDHKQNARKRLHSESTIADTGDTSSLDERRSPRSVKVKEERDADDLPPPKLAAPAPASQKGGPPPQPSSSSSSPKPNPSKKRRMTITGINTDVRRPSVDSGISPVVMGLTIPPDDPTALEQVRSMVNLKHQQQALIESRRGSLASVVPPTAPPDVNIVNSLAASDDRTQSSKSSVRASRRSPNLPAATSGPPRRGSVVAISAPAPPQQHQQSHHPQAGMSGERRPSPPPTAVPISAQRTHPRPATDSPPTQTHVHIAGPSNHTPTPQHSLPTPPISFARRRATRQIGGGLKGKPADIVISPRHPQEGTLQPIIQSAPPIPRGGQSQSLPGRFPSMALPSVPPVMGTGQPPKRISTGPVPPTPTRLSTLRQPPVGSAATGRSPPASVPIATSLVPPTPASLHHPGYTGEKSAFLAPFEAFYDALSDSKQLKGWLGEQLQKSNALISTLQRQQESMEDSVRQLVDKKMASMRSEVYDLKMRVDELESQLRHARAQGYSPNLNSSSVRDKGKANGYGVSSPVVAPTVPEAYHFPPIDSLQQQRRPEPIRRVSSPSSEHQPVSLTGSPVPFDIGKRLSVSAIRHEPPLPPPPPAHGPPSARTSARDRVERDLPHSLPPHPPVHREREHHSGAGSGSMGGWSPRNTKLGLPTSSARHSLNPSTSGLGRRSPIDRGSGHGGHGHGHARHDSTSSIRSVHQHHAPPPEKRRASRSPEADEEGRVPLPPRHLVEQRRTSIGGGSAQQEKTRSDMDTS